MFFGINVIPLDFFSNAFYIPKKSYSSITFLGNTKVDAAYLYKKEMSEDEIKNKITEQYFGVDSIYVANFEGNLQAGNYTENVNPITKFRVKRKKIGNFTPVTLGDIDRGTSEFIDYSQANGQDYEYQLLPIDSTGVVGLPITTQVKSSFFGWFLISLDNSKIYKFDMMNETDNIVLNKDETTFETYTKYPVVRTGKRKYHNGGIRTMPYTWNGNDIDMSFSLLKEIEDFVSDGQTKILKSTKGDIWKVKTSDFDYKYMDNIGEQPYTISFKFKEVEAVE